MELGMSCCAVGSCMPTRIERVCVCVCIIPFHLFIARNFSGDGSGKLSDAFEENVRIYMYKHIHTHIIGKYICDTQTILKTDFLCAYT